MRGIDPKKYLAYLSRKKKKSKFTFRSERQEIIQRFVDKINKGRKNTPFKPVTAARINFLLSHLKIMDLRWFYDRCRRAKNFSKCFFGSLKKESNFIQRESKENEEKKKPIT